MPLTLLPSLPDSKSYLHLCISYLINVNRTCAKQWKLVKAVSFALNYLQKNVEVGFVMNSRDIVVLVYYYAHLIIKVCGTICTSKSFCPFGLLELFYDHWCQYYRKIWNYFLMKRAFFSFFRILHSKENRETLYRR